MFLDSLSILGKKLECVLHSDDFQQARVLLGERLPLELVYEAVQNLVLVVLLGELLEGRVVLVVARRDQVCAFELEQAVLVVIQDGLEEVAKDADLTDDVRNVHFLVKHLLAFYEKQAVALPSRVAELVAVRDLAQADVLFDDV